LAIWRKKIGLKHSLTTRKLLFSPFFCLVWPSLANFSNRAYRRDTFPIARINIRAGNAVSGHLLFALPYAVTLSNAICATNVSTTFLPLLLAMGSAPVDLAGDGVMFEQDRDMLRLPLSSLALKYFDGNRSRKTPCFR
jgi:hypothetical protein